MSFKLSKNKILISIVVTFIWILYWIMKYSTLPSCSPFACSGISVPSFDWGKLSLIKYPGQCCPSLLSFQQILLQYILLLAFPFSVTYIINSLFKKSRRNILYTLMILVLLIILYLLFQYLQERYCLFGYLSNTCMYKNAPLLPPGYVY